MNVKQLFLNLLFVFILCVFMPIAVCAEETIPDGLEYEINNNQVTITGYTGSATELVIPNLIENFPVTHIGDYAFNYRPNLTSISLPNGLVSIGMSAFQDCTGLININIPDSVISIGDKAFYFCIRLETLTLGTSVNSLGSSAFEYCTKLKAVTLNDNLRIISFRAFCDCENLTHINIPVGITQIADYAFLNCGKLDEVSLPFSLEIIGNHTFENCSSLSNIVIPDSVTHIGNYAFYNCSLLNQVVLSNSLSGIGEHVFHNCRNLSSILIPEGIRCIEDSAFRGCISLKSIILPISMRSISHNSFYGCSTLSSITIPNGLSWIGQNAFWGCNILTDVYYTGTEEQWITLTRGSNNDAYEVESGNSKVLSSNIHYNHIIAKVEKWNISLLDGFNLSFYFGISDNIKDNVYITLSVNDISVNYDLTTLKQNECGLFIIVSEIPAVRMNDLINICIINDDEVIITYSFSVRQYCNTILTNESYSHYHTLVKEMLNYGAMAQMYFDYNADNLANDGITDVAITEIPETVEEMTVSGKSGDVNFYGSSLVYRDRIAVRYYFTGDVTGCTFTANGNTHTPVAKDEMYYVEIADILPQDLDQQITLTVTDASGNTLSVTYGPMNYIVRMNEKGSNALKALVKALYNYHLATKTLTA